MVKFKKISPEFKVNKYLILRLEDNRTNIYINGKLFAQCKFLLFSTPTDRVEELNDFESIDEAAEKLDSSLERSELYKYDLTPETEFWGHCSNLQAWYENNYDTRIIHRNLGFPLLKALVRAGDPLAKKVFKEEIALRFESGHPSVVSFLILQNYLKYLDRTDLNTILENPNFIENITQIISNLSNIPKWFYRKIRRLIPRKQRRLLLKRDYDDVYDAIYKIVIFGDPIVNKTQLSQRYLTNLFRTETKMTIGVDFEVKNLEVDDYWIKLQIWDFGGEEKFRFLLPSYVRGANGAIFLYDITNYSTLAHIDDWLMIIRKEIKQEDIFPIIIVGLVSGIEEERQIPSEEAVKIAKSRGVDGFIECTPRTGENVEEIFEALARLMLVNSGFGKTL
ncbi:MAG: Rab family GTPase [Promethearchaeota archaeon]|jgi:small GTP-binding protein